MHLFLCLSALPPPPSTSHSSEHTAGLDAIGELAQRDSRSSHKHTRELLGVLAKYSIKVYKVLPSQEAHKNTKLSQGGNETLGNKTVIANRAMQTTPKCP